MLHIVVLWLLVHRTRPRELMKAPGIYQIDVISMPYKMGLGRL